ncbi:MAG: hypothetical protein KC983_02720, partial [Phycisphaerales bacterium]|nr:hypothetical protein [Phycisphaerales bacterium]
AFVVLTCKPKEVARSASGRGCGRCLGRSHVDIDSVDAIEQVRLLPLDIDGLTTPKAKTALLNQWNHQVGLMMRDMSRTAYMEARGPPVDLTRIHTVAEFRVWRNQPPMAGRITSIGGAIDGHHTVPKSMVRMMIKTLDGEFNIPNGQILEEFLDSMPVLPMNDWVHRSIGNDFGIDQAKVFHSVLESNLKSPAFRSQMAQATTATGKRQVWKNVLKVTYEQIDPEQGATWYQVRKEWMDHAGLS